MTFVTSIWDVFWFYFWIFAYIAYLFVLGDSNWHLRYLIPLYLVSLFVICMTCHGELVRARPSLRFLTRFYLLIALGGAVGGVFVAVIAPHVFDTYLELPLLLISIAGLAVTLQWRRRGSKHTLWPVRFAMAAGILALTGYLVLAEVRTRAENLLVQRNFYGVLRVRDELLGEELAQRNLIHGTISHGYQYLGEAYRDVPGAYFSMNSGVGRVLEAMEARGAIRYGVIGLGPGILASYARQDDYVRLYEINPDVAIIAERLFTFLPHARAAGADVEVLLGDARLTKRPLAMFRRPVCDRDQSYPRYRRTELECDRTPGCACSHHRDTNRLLRVCPLSKHGIETHE